MRLRILCRTLLLVSAMPLFAQPSVDHAFESAACHVAFRYPAGWRVDLDRARSNAPCRFRLRPVAWDSLLVAADSVEDAYTVRIEVEARGLETVLPTTAFRPRAGGWIVGGRHGSEREATAIARNGWSGVRGEPLLGCYRIDGPYVAACELPTAVVGTAHRSAQLWGGVRSFEVFERVLGTLVLRR